ncbi:MAG: hypothetical protein FWG68_12040 [Defluviitaleaceae bacterium]|nr:hypothetical protein [Defluviitaleaceae bacterium]
MATKPTKPSNLKKFSNFGSTAKLSKLNDPKNAVIIAAFLVVAGLLLGSHLSFWQLRSQAASIFSNSTEQTLHRKINMANNVLWLYSTENANEIMPTVVSSSDFVLEFHRNIDQTLAAVGSVSSQLSELNAALTQNAQQTFENAVELGFSDETLLAMQNLLADIADVDLILRQSLYNTVAVQFNEDMRQGLGFLAFFVQRMPVF